MQQFISLNYENTNGSVVITPRVNGNELSVEICRYVDEFKYDPLCVNVLIRGNKVEITYNDDKEVERIVRGII